MSDLDGPGRAAARWPAILGLALAYSVVGWLGLRVASDPGNVTALWPPSGIALAALLMRGRGLWPGVLLGAFVTNLLIAPADGATARVVGSALLIALGSTAEILAATVLVEGFAGGRGLLDSPQRVMRFTVAIAVAASIAATVGLLATVGIGGADVDGVHFWLTWWIGDVVGMLVIAPVAATGALTVRRPLEWMATIAITVAVGEWLFGRPLGVSMGTSWPVLWAMLPAVVWAAVRLGPAAVAMQVLLIHVLASWATVAGSGPFVADGAAGLLLLDAMLIVTNATGLLLVTTVREADVARRTLEDRVAERSAALERAWADAAHTLEEKNKLRAIVVEAQKQEALGRLAGGVAHDFNNLLTVIRAEADFISHGADDDEARESAVTIVGAADRAADLTRQLLAVARRPMARAQCIDVATALQAFSRLARPAVPASIRFEITPGPTVQVAIDPGHLDQVLLNLVLNAKDALRNDGVLTVSHSVTTVTDAEAHERGLPVAGTWVTIDVVDSGAGIAADVVDHIFEPFFTTKATGMGSGLGLPTAAGLIAQAGGALTVTSTAGHGSTFRVWLPLVTTTAVSSTPSSSPPASPTTTTTARTILVVEDDPMVRRTIESALTRRGHQVLVAADGEEGLTLVNAHAGIDLVITDVVMPRMGGLAMLRALRQRWTIPAIVISGYHEHQLELRGERVLVKPFSIEALDAAVDDALKATTPATTTTAASTS